MNSFYQIQEFSKDGEFKHVFQNFDLDGLENARRELKWWNGIDEEFPNLYRLFLIQETEITD